MKLTLTNDDCEIVDVWDLSEWNLSRTIARSTLMREIENEVKREEANDRSDDSLNSRNFHPGVNNKL